MISYNSLLLLLCRQVPSDVEVQEYLDAIVDEFCLLENESEYDTHEDASLEVNPTLRNESTATPKISVTRAFNNEMEHYLFGYGENYGQLSTSNILPDESHGDRKAKPAYDDLNSVEVHTSLDSSQSDIHTNDHEHADMQLPTEVESVFDQVQRFHSSMEEDEKSTRKVSSKPK